MEAALPHERSVLGKIINSAKVISPGENQSGIAYERHWLERDTSHPDGLIRLMKDEIALGASQPAPCEPVIALDRAGRIHQGEGEDLHVLVYENKVHGIGTVVARIQALQDQRALEDLPAVEASGRPLREGIRELHARFFSRSTSVPDSAAEPGRPVQSAPAVRPPYALSN